MATEPKLEGTLTLAGLMETIRDLKELGKAGKKALDDVRKAVQSVEPTVKKLATDIGNLRGALGEIRTNGAAAGRTMAAGFMTAAAAARATATATASIVTAAGRASAAVRSIGSGATKVGAVGAAGIGGAGLLAKSGDEYYRKIEEVSRGTGVSLNGIAVLQEAYKKVGYDMSDINGAFVQLNTVIKDAMGGQEEAVAFFRAIGVDQRQIMSIRTLDDVLPNIINGLNAMPDGVAKTNLAAKFFGEDDGSRFLAATRGGTAALARLQEQMRSAGLLFDSTNATWLRAVSENFNRLWLLIRGVAIEVAVKLAPALYNLIGLFGRLLQDNRATIVDNIARAANVLLVVFRDLYYIMVGRPDLVQSSWLLQIVPAFRSLLASGRELAAQIPGIVESIAAIGRAGVAEALIRGGQVIDELVVKYRAFEAWLIPTIALMQTRFAEMSKAFWELWNSQLKPVWDGIYGAITSVLGVVGDMAGMTAVQVGFGLFLLRSLGVFALLGSVIGMIASAFKAVYFAAVLAWPAISYLVGGMVSMFGGIWTLISGIGATVAAVVGWPVLIAVGIAAAVALIYGYWDEIKSGFSAAWKWIAEQFPSIVPAAEAVGEMIKGWWTDLVRTLSEIWAAFTERGLIAGLARLAKAVADTFVGIGKAIYDGIMLGVKSVFSVIDRMIGYWVQVRDTILQGLSMITGLIGNGFQMGASAVFNTFDRMNGIDMPAATVPAYAMPQTAPAASAGTAINLHLDGKRYETQATGDVAEQLRRYGRETNRLSPTNSPSWW